MVFEVKNWIISFDLYELSELDVITSAASHIGGEYEFL